jgi:hypothetical protein
MSPADAVFSHCRFVWQYAPLKRRSTIILLGNTSQKTILNMSITFSKHQNFLADCLLISFSKTRDGTKSEMNFPESRSQQWTFFSRFYSKSYSRLIGYLIKQDSCSKVRSWRISSISLCSHNVRLMGHAQKFQKASKFPAISGGKSNLEESQGQVL